MKKTMYVLAAVGLLTAVGAVSAARIDFGLVSDYAPGSGNSFTIGGITFSDFTAVPTTYGGALPVGGDGIALSGDVVGNLAVLRFNGGWSAAAGQWVDTTIDFKAVSTQPILSNALELTAYGSSGGATISITENVKDTQYNPIADKEVVWYSGKPENKSLIDTARYPANTTSVLIHKDIFVSGGTEGLGHISGFTQGFEVPEPITLALLGLGGLVLRRKR